MIEHIDAEMANIVKEFLETSKSALHRKALEYILQLERHGSDGEELVERLAALSHEQWSGWAHWMFEKWDKMHASGESFQDRWKRQMTRPYHELSEAEKESDRIEASKILALMEMKQ